MELESFIKNYQNIIRNCGFIFNYCAKFCVGHRCKCWEGPMVMKFNRPKMIGIIV